MLRPIPRYKKPRKLRIKRHSKTRLISQLILRRNRLLILKKVILLKLLLGIFIRLEENYG